MSLRGRPGGAGPPVLRSFLLVRCGETCLALPAEIVQGFHDHRAWEPGRAMDRPPDELGLRIGLPPAPAAAERPVVLVGDGAEPIPFLVDEVAGMVEVPSGAIRPLPAHFAGAERGRFGGLFLTETGLALVINGWWLVGREPAAHPSATWLEAPSPSSAASVDTAATPEVTEAEAVAYDEPPGGPVAPGPAPPETGAGTPAALDRIDVEEAADGEDAPWAEI